MEKEKKIGSNLLKTIFILLAVAFISQSIIYLIRGNDLLNLDPCHTFFFTPFSKGPTPTKIIGTIFFVGLFGGLAVTYCMILKKREELFKTKKQLITFIVGVAGIFFVMLPLTSTDVFYYMGTGWLEAKYDVNPYYTSIQDVMKDKELYDSENPDSMLLRTPGVWRGTTIVYGPVWPMICKVLSGLSGGNIAIALLLYKLFNLLLHLANCALIYKISKKKKLFTLLYALNPLVLFDGLANVHNDLLVVFFILAALYFFVRKKKMLPTVIFLALATAVKYFAILLIPFLVIYHYRKAKPSKRIVYACGWGILFLAILVGTYLIYMRDLEVLKGVFVQQSKFMNSIFLVTVLNTDIKTGAIFSKGCMLAFVLIYLYTIIKYLFTKKKLSFSVLMREYTFLLILFIFGTITNFQTWYCIWLLPTILWVRGKTANTIIAITISVELANTIYFILFEYYKYGQFYYIMMLVLIFILSKINVNKILKIGGGIREKSIEGK